MFFAEEKNEKIQSSVRICLHPLSITGEKICLTQKKRFCQVAHIVAHIANIVAPIVAHKVKS